MTCAEFKELAAAYVLGALSAEETAAFRAHLQGGTHEGCLERLRQLSEEEEFPMAAPDRVVVDRPMPALERIGPAPELRRAPAPPKRHRIPPASAREWLAWTLVVLAFTLFAFVYSAWDEAARQVREAKGSAAQSEQYRRQCESSVSALGGHSPLYRDAAGLLAKPGTQVMPLTAQSELGNASGSVIVGDQGTRAIVLSSALTPSASTDYQLWVSRKGAPPEPAGFLTEAGPGVSAGEVDGRLLGQSDGAPETIAISREPKGGRAVPTEIVMSATVPGR